MLSSALSQSWTTIENNELAHRFQSTSRFGLAMQNQWRTKFSDKIEKPKLQVLELVFFPTSFSLRNKLDRFQQISVLQLI